MELDATFRPWLIADGMDMRPILDHVLIERTEGGRGVLVAADGFALLVLPVTLAGDDVPGLLRAELLKWAWNKWQSPLRVQLAAGEATLPDGSRHARVAKGTDATYPDWRKIAAAATVEAATGPVPPFDPRRLRTLAKALGTGAVWLIHGEARAPLLVRDGDGGGLEPPYGLLMPMLDLRAAPPATATEGGDS